MKQQYPHYEVNGRRFYQYESTNLWESALAYWKEHGGVMMSTLDAYTPAYVLCQTTR